MKKLLISLSLVILFVCCTKDKVQCANDLLQAYSNNYGSVTELDSVLGYQESFDMLTKAANIRHDADSIVKMQISILEDMKHKGMTEEMYKLAEETKASAINMYNAAYEYDSRANFINFEKKSKGEHQIFLGYKSVNDNDSCTYTVYFDKDITKIICIDKKLKTKEN